MPDLESEPQLTAPSGPDAAIWDPEKLADYAKAIFVAETAAAARRATNS